MRKLFIGLFLAVVVASCSTNPSGLNNSGVPTQPLMPLAPGNTWIYNDTIFAATDTVYADTVLINNNALGYTAPNGNITFYGVTDSDTTGLFAGTYMGLDPSNAYLYQYDSSESANPYIYFGTATSDNTPLAQGPQQDPTTPSCTDLIALYGFATTTVINGHTCLKNVETITNCSNVVIEEEITYMDPGIGLVRFEDYQLNSAGVLAIDFSQTLVSDTL